MKKATQLRGLFFLVAVVTAMAVTAVTMVTVMAMVAMMTMMPAMMMVVMAGRCVVHRLAVIHRGRTNVVHRRLVVIDAAGNVAVAEDDSPADARVSGCDIGTQQAANEQ